MTDRLRQALTAVSSAAAELAETTSDYDRLVGTIARCGARILASTCAISMLAEDEQTLTPVAIYDEDPAISARAQTTLVTRPLGEAVSSTLSAPRGTLFLPALDLEAVRPKLSEIGYGLMKDVGVHGMIVVLLRVRGETQGLVTIMRHRTDLPPLDDFDREIAEYFANLAGLALANARLFRRAQDEHAARLVAEQQSEERARQATAFLDAIIENIPDLVFVKEADRLSFVRFNRAGEQLLGIPRAQLLGKSDSDFFPPDEAKFFVDKDRETLLGKKLVDIAEEPIQTAAGERWLHTKKVPILDAAGEPRFLLGISEDITDRKRDVAALRASKDSAEAANRELEAFSYSVAHDLRAPLRAIDGFSQALLEDYAAKLGEVGKSYLDRVRAGAQRMAELIDDLLKLSQVARAGVRAQKLDLGELFRAAIATLQRAEPNRAVEIVIARGVAALGDPMLLSVLFDNLCGNAWKFTAKTPAPRIELGVTEQDGERVIFVRDNGAGFDMAYVHKLFGVFQRLHRETDFPGTGIGLATVQRIITRHGGRVWAEGAVGSGATFYFTLGAPP